MLALATGTLRELRKQCVYPFATGFSNTIYHSDRRLTTINYPKQPLATPPKFIEIKRNSSILSTDLSNLPALALKSIEDIQMSEISKAPTAVFWMSTLGFVPVVCPTLFFALFGYSPTLATLQMTFCATLSAFLAGGKFENHILNESTATWENISLSTLPQALSVVGLLLPQQLGFIFITLGIAAVTLVELISTKNPGWYRAMRLAFTIPTIAILSLTALLRLFH